MHNRTCCVDRILYGRCTAHGIHPSTPAVYATVKARGPQTIFLTRHNCGNVKSSKLDAHTISYRCSDNFLIALLSMCHELTNIIVVEWRTVRRKCILRMHEMFKISHWEYNINTVMFDIKCAVQWTRVWIVKCNLAGRGVSQNLFVGWRSSFETFSVPVC